MRDLGVSAVDALMRYNLAPLCSRRDIAMVGVIHRAALGLGPHHLRTLFPPAAARGTRSPARLRKHFREREVLIDNSQFAVVERSAFGLVRVYNLLPEELVCPTSVAHFQGLPQTCLKDKATSGTWSWRSTFSPRLSFDSHPVRRL